MLDKERKSENEVTGADIRNLSHPLQMAGFSSIRSADGLEECAWSFASNG